MQDINKVVLVGRLTKDCELTFTPSGVALAKMSIAVNRKKKKGDEWIEEASFFDITLWNKRAEALSPYLLKAQQIAVEGQLVQSRWEQDGQKRSRVVVEASNIQLLGGRNDNSGQNGAPAQNNNAPTQNNPQQGTPSQPFNSYSAPPAVPEERFEDSIPF